MPSKREWCPRRLTALTVALFLIAATVLTASVFPFQEARSWGQTVTGSPAGTGGDTNPTTFKFNKDNIDTRLTKESGTPIDLDQVASLYGTRDGMRVYVNGVDVTDPAYTGPGGPKTPIGMDLSAAAGWPDVYIPPGKIAIDPNVGRFKFYERVPGGSYDTNVAMDLFVRTPYAYVADGGDEGLQIIDVSNPASPKLAHAVTTNAALDVYVSGNYAYLTKSLEGLQIYDISDPLAPKQIRRSFLTNGSEIVVKGIYAYMVTPNGLQIIDVSVPATPSLKGSYSIGKTISDISLYNNLAFLPVVGEGVHIVDISVPATPKRIGHFPSSLAAGVFATADYAYVAAGEAGLQVVNVSNPAAPSLVGTLPGLGDTAKVFVAGTVAYIAASHAGLQVVNISDPKNPTLSKTFDTPGLARGVSVHGNYAYLADHVSGLQIIDLNSPASETPNGPVTVDYNYASSPPPPPPPPLPTPKKVHRLWGMTSADTAIAICQTGWEDGSKAALVARDDYFTDALAGGPLAKFLALKHGNDAPILLTDSSFLTARTKQELVRLGADTVYLLGGPGAVSDVVKKTLEEIPGVRTVKRLWGFTSYGTAQAIKNEMDRVATETSSPAPTTAIITTGENFPDSLVISGPAASKNMPILLVKPFTSEPPPETQAALRGIKKTIIVGGPGAVHPSLETWLNPRGHTVIKRLWGLSEYDTAIDVIKGGEPLFGFDRSTVLATRGDYFTDALAGGAFAARGPFPMVLVKTQSIPQPTSQWLQGNKAAIETMYILGGWGAVSNDVASQIGVLIN